MKSPPNSLFFIQLKDASRLSADSFQGFDPAVPLPVLVESEGAAPGASDVLAALSEESVLAGILAVFASDLENPHKDYYRTLAARIRPHIREELGAAALMHQRNGNEALAEEILLALKGMNPDDREITLNLALLYDGKSRRLFRAGKDGYKPFAEEAARFYDESMRLDPPLPEAFFSAALFYLWRKDYARALEAAKTYMALETRDDDTAELRKEKACDIARAIEEGSLASALFKAACDALRKDEPERALENAQEFLKSRPDVWNAYFVLGWALRRLEKWSDAKGAFLKAIELRNAAAEKSGGEDETGEGFADICNEIAICSIEENNLGEARQWLMAALESDSENTKVIANLGVLAWKEGDFDEAEAFFKAAVEINPDDEAARELLQEIKGF